MNSESTSTLNDIDSPMRSEQYPFEGVVLEGKTSATSLNNLLGNTFKLDLKPAAQLTQHGHAGTTAGAKPVE